MRLFKKKITEKAAAAHYVMAVFQNIEKSWPTIKKSLLDAFRGQFKLEAPTLASVDFTLAVIAFDLQALPNLFHHDQAERIRKVVTAIIADEADNGKYAQEEIALYSHAYEVALTDPLNEGNPIHAIPARLVCRLIGKDAELENMKIVSPLLTMSVTGMMMNFVGLWKTIRDELK